jgi:hypothetical protein
VLAMVNGSFLFPCLEEKEIVSLGAVNICSKD